MTNPWLRDLQKEVCQNCKYYTRSCCNRYPPSVKGEFPNINDSWKEWCGEFKQSARVAAEIEKQLYWESTSSKLKGWNL